MPDTTIDLFSAYLIIWLCFFLLLWRCQRKTNQLADKIAELENAILKNKK